MQTFNQSCCCSACCGNYGTEIRMGSLGYNSIRDSNLRLQPTDLDYMLEDNGLRFHSWSPTS